MPYCSNCGNPEADHFTNKCPKPPKVNPLKKAMEDIANLPKRKVREHVKPPDNFSPEVAKDAVKIPESSSGKTAAFDVADGGSNPSSGAMTLKSVRDWLKEFHPELKIVGKVDRKKYMRDYMREKRK